jgi:predicted dehydrogenase
MFSKEDLDFVYVATPDFAHREPVVAAAERGVNILVEKPLAITVEDATAMLAAVKKAGVKAEVNFSNRWNPPFVAAKRVLDSDEIGKVLSVNARLNCSIAVPTEKLPWAARSTVAWFLHTHTIDLATWMLGKKAISVYASGVKKRLVAMNVDTYDAVHAVVCYEDGTDGVFESIWVLPQGAPFPVDFKYQVMCTDGALYMDTHDQMIHKVTSMRRVHEPTLDWSRARLEAYLEMLEQDLPPAASLEDGVENTRILVSLHRSLETGLVEDI